MKLNKEQVELLQEFIDKNKGLEIWLNTRGSNLSDSTKAKIVVDGPKAWDTIIDDMYIDWGAEEVYHAEIYEVAEFIEENKEGLDRLNLPLEPPELRDILIFQLEWGGAKIDFSEYLRGETCLVTVPLTRDGMGEPSIYPPFDVDDYDNAGELLDFLEINPREFANLYNDGTDDWEEPDWFPNMPDRNNPIVSPEGLKNIIDESFYSGSMYALIEMDLEWYIKMFDALQEGCIIRKETMIMQHDYINGSTGGYAALNRDLVIKSPNFYVDETDRYGIQACCGLIRSAWTDGIDLITEQLEV